MSDFIDKAKDKAQDAANSEAGKKVEEQVESKADDGGKLGSLADKGDDAIDEVQGTKD